MLNKVQLIGFTGAEAEVRTTSGGKKVATLRVATSRYTKAGGERKDYTTWHQVEIWNQATVNWLASRGLPKGAKVFVQEDVAGMVGDGELDAELDEQGQASFTLGTQPSSANSNGAQNN